MRKSAPLSILLVFSICAMFGCESGNGLEETTVLPTSVVDITHANPDNKIKISSGDQFVIYLRTESYEYSWWEPLYDSYMVELINSEYERILIVEDLTSIAMWFTFMANKTGKTEIIMKYIQTNSPLIQETVFTVEIQ